MSTSNTFQTTLDIIDDGLLLYRKGFTSFIVIASIWLVPVAVGVGISIAAAHYWGETAVIFIILAWMVLAVPLAIYLIGSLSRATKSIQEGHHIRLREALAIHPLRLVGMGCYTIVFYIFATIISSMFSMMCICPIYLVMLTFLGSISSAFGDTGSGLGEGVMVAMSIIVLLLLMLLYGFSLAISGATHSSLVYALQPFIQETTSFGDSLERSIKLIIYRFGRNLLAFLLTSMVFAATAIAASIAIGVLLPLPLFWALGAESPVAQISSALSWMIGLVIVLPPVPIWMTLLYERNRAAHDGAGLQTRIAGLDVQEGYHSSGQNELP